MELGALLEEPCESLRRGGLRCEWDGLTVERSSSPELTVYAYACIGLRTGWSCLVATISAFLSWYADLASLKTLRRCLLYPKKG